MIASPPELLIDPNCLELPPIGRSWQLPLLRGYELVSSDRQVLELSGLSNVLNPYD